MAVKVTHVKHSDADIKRYEGIIEKAAAAAKSEVRCWLDRRFSERETVVENNKKQLGWGAYVRALLTNDHTVYLALPSEKVSVSEDPMTKGRLMKIEAKERRQADRVAKREAKAVAKSAPKAKGVKSVKAPKIVQPKSDVVGTYNSLADLVAKIQRTEKVGHTKAVEMAKQQMVKA